MCCKVSTSWTLCVVASQAVSVCVFFGVWFCSWCFHVPSAGSVHPDRFCSSVSFHPLAPAPVCSVRPLWSTEPPSRHVRNWWIIMCVLSPLPVLFIVASSRRLVSCEFKLKLLYKFCCHVSFLFRLIKVWFSLQKLPDDRDRTWNLNPFLNRL